jgi:hypothetical protein
MSHEPAVRLSGPEVVALKFAAHRQLSRWSRPGLNEQQHAQRAALTQAARVIQDRVFAHGCELRPSNPEADR